MSTIDWMREVQAVPSERKQPQLADRLKFLVGLLLLGGAVWVLLVNGTLGGVRYFITIDELMRDSQAVGQTVRLTGAVIGSTIDYNPQTLDLSFTLAHVSMDTPDLALALHQAVLDPSAPRLRVVMSNQVKPDLLLNEAQAIVTGKLLPDGTFAGDSVLLKCPSRFSEAHPGEAALAQEGVQ